MILIGALFSTACTPTVNEGGDPPASDNNGGAPGGNDNGGSGTKPENDAAQSPIATPEVLKFNTDIEITESGDSATVSANDGLTYTAAGYNTLKGNAFLIKNGFTVSFTECGIQEDFNRFSIGYASNKPLKCTVCYTEGGEEIRDVFYLEAGERTFSALTCGYLDGKRASGISSMTFDIRGGYSATLALCMLKTYDYPIYSSGEDGTYYVRNDRFELGIRLSWGGGINYIRDLANADAVSGVTNLINQADTGRLVQQSYYGAVSDGDYTAGIYNGTQWRYNPVQGGDLMQNRSRLIDIAIKEGSVYVKAQPMDWSLNGAITPSYMENAYTLFDDRIQVDNRFVDFSGMDHPYYHQELPAFYTLSCFERFNWYDGSNGWCGEDISYRDDLGFWGDAAYYDDCTFLIKKSNRETWCAWTNAAANYGIGLYVPNTDSYLAGRHVYTGSTSSTSGSTNYVAPVNTLKITPYTAIEYSYLITTGSVEEIRTTFTENRDFATNASLHNNYQSRRTED